MALEGCAITVVFLRLFLGPLFAGMGGKSASSCTKHWLHSVKSRKTKLKPVKLAQNPVKFGTIGLMLQDDLLKFGMSC